MRIKFILHVALSVFLLASTTLPAAPQASNQLAASAAVTAPSKAPIQAMEPATSSHLAWYADPIVLAFAIAALFAAIDIAILFSKHTHTGRRRHA